MRIDTESSVFAGNSDEDTDNEWLTRDDVFSGAESMDESGWEPHELADEWEYAEADNEYAEYQDLGEAGADEEGDLEAWGDNEAWADSEAWEETAWEADDESSVDHECAHCGHAVALLESPDEEAPRGRRGAGALMLGAKEVSSERLAADWQSVGIAQVGGAVGLAGGIACFDFRSKSADFRGTYLFVGGGLGLGGSLGGGLAPSPGDFIHNTPPDVWSALEVQRPFSGKELDLAYASVSSLGAAAAYGYTLMSITGGWVDPLFTAQNVSGWGTGVGVAGAMLIGVWKLIGERAYY